MSHESDEEVLVPHPACAAFPMMNQEELEKLADDIEQNGLVEPIVLHDGQILDGRNRLAACGIAGVEPEFREYEGLESELLAWVLSKNLHRRHLTTSQRSAIAHELSTLRRGGQPGIRQMADSRSQEESAELLNVSVRSVQRAAVVGRADPALHEAIKRGELKVSEALQQVRPPRAAEEPELDAQYLEDRAREAAAVAAELALEDEDCDDAAEGDERFDDSDTDANTDGADDSPDADCDNDSDVEFEVPTCRVCGCTDDDCVACSVAQGEPCGWVVDPEGQDLCSRCADEILARELVATVTSLEREPGAPVPLTLVEKRGGFGPVQADQLAEVAERLGLLRVLGRVVRRVVAELAPVEPVVGPPNLVVTRDQIYREERDRRRAEAQTRKETRNRELTATASAAAPALPGLDLRLCDVADLLADPALASSAELIHADPPWSYDRADRNGAVDGHYDLLSMADIARHLDAAYDLALPDARLLLWVTDPLLAEWFAASSGMRWRFVSAGGWVKTGRPGIGAHWRGDHEPLLMYVKGTPRRPERLLSNGHAGPRTEHSEKPESWLTDLVGGLTGPGALVVDLYAGRAPLLRACFSADRRYAGAEIDPERRALAFAALGREAPNA